MSTASTPRPPFYPPKNCQGGRSPGEKGWGHAVLDTNAIIVAAAVNHPHGPAQPGEPRGGDGEECYINKESHVMYQTSCWNKIPKKASRNSVTSHYSNCCRTPVPPARSLFQFLPGLCGCSFTSLPFGAHTPSDSKQLLINLLSTSLPRPFSFFKRSLPDGQTPSAARGAQHGLPRPFPTLFLAKLLRSPAALMRCGTAQTPNLPPSPCCQGSQSHLFVRQSHLLWDGRSYELTAHATETGNSFRELLARDPLLSAAPRTLCCLLFVFTKNGALSAAKVHKVNLMHAGNGQGKTPKSSRHFRMQGHSCSVRHVGAG